MKAKILALLVILSMVMSLCVGCSSIIAMPYSSKEYANGEWTIEELEEHFEELGFTEIEVIGNTTEVIGVLAENDESLFESFEKGEEIPVSREIWIETAFEITPPLTVENSPEFAYFVENGIDSPKNTDDWIAFLEEHEGDLIEFDGTITNWYDEMFWVSISFSIAIEDSKYMSFSKSNVDLIDLGMTGDYHYNKYHTGLITEGMQTHVVVSIKRIEDGWCLELESIEIVK